MKKEFLSSRKYNSKCKLVEKQLLISLNMYENVNLGNYRDFASLSNYEMQKLNEICGCYKSLKEENSMKNVVEIQTRQEWLQHEENLLKFLIGMVKKMSCFQPFPMEDKLIMIKKFFVVYFNLRFIFSYDEEKEALYMLEINEQKVCFKTNFQMWNELISEDMERAWRLGVVENKTLMMNDPIIRDLIITLSMFRQDSAIISSDLLRYKHLEILYLLQRYLQVKLRYRDKYEKHLKFMHYMSSKTPELYDKIHQLYQIVKPFHSSQLINEIYQQRIVC